MASHRNRAAGSYGANRTFNGTALLPPLTEAEKSVLKDGWGNEFKFLQSYGLSIYDDAERAEGRDILKGYVSATQSSRATRADYRAGYSSRNRNPASSDSTAQPHVASHRFRDNYEQRRAHRPASNTSSTAYSQHDLPPTESRRSHFGHPSSLMYRTDDHSRRSIRNYPSNHVYGRNNGNRSYRDNGGNYGRVYGNGGRNAYDRYGGGEGYNHFDGHDNNDAYDNVDRYGNGHGYGGGYGYDRYD